VAFIALCCPATGWEAALLLYHRSLHITAASSPNEINSSCISQDEKCARHICLPAFHGLPCDGEQNSSAHAVVPSLIFGDTELKTKDAAPNQLAAGHHWRQKLDTIGLIACSVRPQVSAKHSCHLLFWEETGIYKHLVIAYSL